MNELIPDVGVTPIPGTAWLFHLLLVLTFFLHLLFMNLTLGGTLLAAIAHGLAKRRGEERSASGVLAGRLTAINTYSISLTITTGIAPLLFVQLLYQQFFYTATILIAWVWLFLLVLLMAGYYAVYLYKFKGAPAVGKGGGGWLWLAAILFLAIAMIHVAVNLTHSQPGQWAALADDAWAILSDPAYWPRLLHFVLAALGFTGLLTAWWATRQARAGHEPELNAEIARFGWRWGLWTTLLQIVDGFVLLLVLPREVLGGLLGGGAAGLLPLAASVLLALGLLLMLARVRRPVDSPGLVTGALAAMVVVIAVMAIVRQQVRALYLEPVRSAYELLEAPQWGNFAAFAVLLVAGLALTAYMVWVVLANPAEGEEAA